jgi:ankyrin repeat protein
MEEALVEAVQGGDQERVRALLAAQPSLAGTRADDGVSVLLHALYRGDRALAELLRRDAPPLDVFDAAALGETARLAELLDGDPSLVHARSPDGFTALHLAAFFGATEAARLLVERGADIAAVAANPMRVMPLHSAAAGRHAEIVTLLLAAGAPADEAQQGGYTPLHAAAANGDAVSTDALLAHGADPRRPNDAGQDALTLAREHGHTEIERRLASGD